MPVSEGICLQFSKRPNLETEGKKVEAKVFTLHVSKYPIAVGATGLGIYRII